MYVIYEYQLLMYITFFYIIKKEEICIHYYDVCFISVSPFYFDDRRVSFIHLCHCVLGTVIKYNIYIDNVYDI